MNAEFYEALALLEEEKGIPQEYMFEKIRDAIEKAVKRDKNVNPENVGVVFDKDKKTIRVFIRREVVEEVTPENMGISLEDAKKINEKYQLGDFVEQDYDTTTVGSNSREGRKERHNSGYKRSCRRFYDERI